MMDTIEASLNSILRQLDDRFEVLIVDDGSSDAGPEIVEKMQRHHDNLRLIKLKRNRKRKLGFTRNISVKESKGEYVLLHLDCDDVYGPYLIDFVTAFHQIEKQIGKDFLLSGQHINIAKRSFLIEHGPYRNIFRGEDRDLWMRLAAKNLYIPFYHTDFVTRLPKTVRHSAIRAIKHTWSHLITDFRTGMSLKEFLKHERQKRHKRSKILNIFRTISVIPAWMISKTYPPLPLDDVMRNPDNFKKYREENYGTLSEIMEKYKGKADFSKLSKKGRKIFS